MLLLQRRKVLGRHILLLQTHLYSPYNFFYSKTGNTHKNRTTHNDKVDKWVRRTTNQRNTVAKIFTMSVLKDDLLSESSRDALHKQFSNNKPFPYAIINQLCDEQSMRAIQTEILRELPATFKETDL
jgi:hypothetical protein